MKPDAGYQLASGSASGSRRGRPRTTPPRSRRCARRSRAATSTRSISSSTSSAPLRGRSGRRSRLRSRRCGRCIRGRSPATAGRSSPPRRSSSSPAAATGSWTMPIKGTRPTGEDIDDVEGRRRARDDRRPRAQRPLARLRRRVDSLARADGAARARRRHASRLDRRGPPARRRRPCRDPARDLPRRLDHGRAEDRRRSTTSPASSRSAAARRWARSGPCTPNGDFELALTIRTFAVADGRIHLWVGGGIVWDSEPEAEIEESWVKARPLLAAVGGNGARVDAARGRRRRAAGLVDPEAPVFRADDEALLRGSAAFETLRSLRRPCRSCSSRHIDRLPLLDRRARPAAADGAEELVALVVGAAPPDHVLRLYRTEQLLVATAAALPPGLEELRAPRPRAAARSTSARPPPLLAGVKTTSYGEAFAARRAAERQGADEALLVAGRARARGGDGQRLVAPRRRAVHAGDAAPASCPASRGSSCSSSRPSTAGAFPLADLLAADEAFTTSSIREVMPVVALDGKPVGDGRPGPAAARLQAALRLRSTAVSEPVRLGGMALANGVLVHGPKAWACAVRTDDGELKVVARRKRFRASTVENPLLRGPARLAEAFALLPQVKRALPEARLPFERPRVLAAMARQRGRRSRRSSARGCSPLVRELLASVLSLAPGRAGAARRRARRVSRRRAHLDRHLRARSVAPEGARALRLASASARCCSRPPPANLVSEQVPARYRPAARVGRLGRRGRGVGRDLRLDDAQPGSSARPRACEAGPRAPAPARHARAERRAARGRRRRAAGVPGARAVITTRKRLDPSVFDLPVEKMRAGWYTDAYFNHTREALRYGRPQAARPDAGLPEAARLPRRDGRGARDPQAVRRRLGRAHRARALRRRPDRAVRDGPDDRGRLHDVRASRDGSTSGRSRGGR